MHDLRIISTMQSFSDKYQPKTLQELILDSETKQKLQAFITSGSIPNILLAGAPGTGKSTLAKILVNELRAEVLYINAALDNGIDIVRTRIQDFTKILTMDDKCKIVILDEADSLSRDAGGGSSAQAALRNIIDTSLKDTAFILTANYAERIIDPIQSRCVKIPITFTKKDVIALIAGIITEEKITYTKESFLDFVQSVVNKQFPDIRNILGTLQINTSDGKLSTIKIFKQTAIDEVADELFAMLISRQPQRAIREYCIRNSHIFLDDWESLGGKIFDRYSEAPGNQIEIGNKLMIIADGLYRIKSVTINQEIQFSAMCLALLHK